MKISAFFQSKQLKWILFFLGFFIIILFVFSAGVYVGVRKAAFSYRWGENYHRIFGGPKGGFFQDFKGKDFIPGHGTVGSVISINSDSLIIKSPDGVEKMIIVNANTTIRRGSETMKPADIAIDSRVVVIGSPRNDGTIEAKFIRVMDPWHDPPLLPGPRYFPPTR